MATSLPPPRNTHSGLPKENKTTTKVSRSICETQDVKGDGDGECHHFSSSTMYPARANAWLTRSCVLLTPSLMASCKFSLQLAKLQLVSSAAASCLGQHSIWHRLTTLTAAYSSSCTATRCSSVSKTHSGGLKAGSDICTSCSNYIGVIPPRDF